MPVARAVLGVGIDGNQTKNQMVEGLGRVRQVDEKGPLVQHAGLQDQGSPTCAGRIAQASMNTINPQTMNADSDAALAIERARGVPIPDGREFDATFKIGFAQGAQWALDKIKEAA